MSQEQKAWPHDGGGSHTKHQAPFDVKRLQCWYWTHGGCTWSDGECRYAHCYTGKVAERPIMRANGYSVAGRNATSERPVYRRWQGRGNHSNANTSDDVEGAGGGQHEMKPHNFHSPGNDSHNYFHEQRASARRARRSSSDRRRSAEREGARGRGRVVEDPDMTNLKSPKSRSRSPYTGNGIPHKRERSPRATPSGKEKGHSANGAQLKAEMVAADKCQTINASKNDSVVKNDNDSANIKLSLDSQAQNAPSNARAVTQSSYTFPSPQSTSITKAESGPSGCTEASHPQISTTMEQAPSDKHTMEPLLEAIQLSTSLDEKPILNNIEHLQNQPSMHQPYSQTTSHYRSVQSISQRHDYGYQEPSSTMVTMTMNQYSQMRAYQDHMQRELYHYCSHHRRAEQVIEYQSVLLTEAQSLLESGKKLLTDEGHLAMDLSQKIQRGETIHPDLVTDAWLGATDMLRQAEGFSSMLDEWSRAVSMDHGRNASTSSANPAGEPGHNLAAPVGNQGQD